MNGGNFGRTCYAEKENVLQMITLRCTVNYVSVKDQVTTRLLRMFGTRWRIETTT